MISWQEVLLRLGIALVLCGAVGVERYFAGKAAGPRTHILVGLGAAIFTIISGYAFHVTRLNADRIAAQVVTGLGFIGGGVILKERGSIKGMTTAAGIWVVGAIGMAAGAAMYSVAGFGTLIVLATLMGLGRAERIVPRRIRQTWQLSLTLSHGVTPGELESLLSPHCRSITLQELEWTEGGWHVTFLAELTPRTNLDDVTTRLQQAGARSATWTLYGNAETEVAF